MRFKQPIWFDLLPSTNSYLRQMLEKDPSLSDGTVIAARSQVQGRGRSGRSWENFPNQNLTFSWLLKTDVEISNLPTLPLVVGMAVANVLKKLNLPCRVKWPNDVLVGGKKICGILAEYIRLPAEDLTAAIVGVGLNVNIDQVSAEKIDRPATSIFIETGQKMDVENVLGLLLDELSAWIEKWKDGGFSAIREEWIDLCDNIGTEISVLTADGKTQTGIFEDIGQNGQVLLRAGNLLKEIWAGDIFPA